jgi:glyoxylase-like metal-dependent hydrolase (beta-lactamase superfamily II)
MLKRYPKQLHELMKAWGMAACDVSSRVEYTPEQRLPAAIAKTGNRIEDVKAIVIGHLHNDHAGCYHWAI